MQFPAQSGRPKRGCLGCLTRVTLALLFGCIFILLVTAIFAPWGFFLGGKFHLIPYWQGWGRLHSAISGDYIVFVRFEPSSHGRLFSSVTGIGYICTPRGETIRLTLTGDMRKHLNLSTDGEAISLSMNHRPGFLGISPERRPRIELRGHWKNPNLVMDDNGSISRAFEPDGSVYLGHDQNRPYKAEVIPVTLTDGSYSRFESACAATHQR